MRSENVKAKKEAQCCFIITFMHDTELIGILGFIWKGNKFFYNFCVQHICIEANFEDLQAFEK